LRGGRARGRVARALLPPPDPREQQLRGEPLAPSPERAPEPSDRAPPLPRPALVSVPGARAAREGPLREARAPLQHRELQAADRHRRRAHPALRAALNLSARGGAIRARPESVRSGARARSELARDFGGTSCR